MYFNKVNKNKDQQMIMNQIKDVDSCLTCFENFMTVAVQSDAKGDVLEKLSQSVHQKENEADNSLRAMVDSLAEGGYLPSTREELVSLATNCDKIANKAEELVRNMCIQKFAFPAFCKERVLNVVANTKKMMDLLEESISRMYEDFGGLLKDHAILDDIRALESKVDVDEQSMLREVYAMNLGLAEKQQMAQFIDWLCNISDIQENIADRIQVMIITRKA